MSCLASSGISMCPGTHIIRTLCTLYCSSSCWYSVLPYSHFTIREYYNFQLGNIYFHNNFRRNWHFRMKSTTLLAYGTSDSENIPLPTIPFSLHSWVAVFNKFFTRCVTSFSQSFLSAFEFYSSFVLLHQRKVVQFLSAL